MKDIFPGYYSPTEGDFSELWDKGIFVFDTNILLNLYRYTPKTRERFFDILTKLSDRIWIPFQIAKEYQENRLVHISNLEVNHKQVKESFKNRDIEISENIYNQLMTELDGRIKEYADLFMNDTIRIRIDELFKSKIGPEYTAEELSKLYNMGEERYNNKIPPGYEDAKEKKDYRKFGDLVLWRQIIDRAIKNENSIIFITDDAKEDWWNKCHGKTSGPRPELIKEFVTEAHTLFHMYSSDRFAEYAKDYLKLKEDKAAIREMEKIARYSAEESKIKLDEVSNNLERLALGLDQSKWAGMASAFDQSKMAGIASAFDQSKMAGIASALDQSKWAGMASAFDQSKMAGIGSTFDQSKMADLVSFAGGLDQSKWAGMASALDQSKMAGIASAFDQSKMAGIASALDQSKMAGIGSTFDQSKMADLVSFAGGLDQSKWAGMASAFDQSKMAGIASALDQSKMAGIASGFGKKSESDNLAVGLFNRSKPELSRSSSKSNPPKIPKKPRIPKKTKEKKR